MLLMGKIHTPNVATMETFPCTLEEIQLFIIMESLTQERSIDRNKHSVNMSRLYPQWCSYNNNICTQAMILHYFVRDQENKHILHAYKSSTLPLLSHHMQSL